MSLLLTLAFACAPTPTPEVAAAAFPITALPACELLPAGTDIDVRAGCALGVCANMTYAEFTAILGEPDDCDPTFSDKIECVWSAGVSGNFTDADGDELVEDTSTTSFVYVEDPGLASPEGLGLGLSLQCFLDQLGLAEDVSLDVDELVGDTYFVEGMTYSFGLYLRAAADGRCDHFGMSGPD
jgi:hypothetical protein